MILRLVRHLYGRTESHHFNGLNNTTPNVWESHPSQTTTSNDSANKNELFKFLQLLLGITQKYVTPSLLIQIQQ